MTTEHVSKETASPKTEKPKQAFSAEAGQELEAPQPSLDLTPQNILYLQRTIGNQAVRRIIANFSLPVSTLQRDTATTTKHGKKSATPKVGIDDAIIVVQAMADILQNKLTRLIDQSPPQYQHALRLLYQARMGSEKSTAKERTSNLDAALHELEPAMRVMFDNNEGNQENFREQVVPYIVSLRKDLAFASAKDRVENAQLLPGQNKVVELPSGELNDETAEAYAKALSPSIEGLISTFSMINEQILSFGEKEFRSVFKEMEKGWDNRMLQMERSIFKNPASLAQVQGILRSLSGVMSVKGNWREFSEAHGFVSKASNFVEFVKNATQLISGLTTTALFLTARVFQLQGNLKLATQLTGLASNSLSMFKIDKIIGYIEIVHGLIVLADPDENVGGKIDAAVEVTSGVASAIPGVAGGAFALSLSVNYILFKAILMGMGELKASFAIGGLKPIFEYMSQTGNKIKANMDYLIKAGLILKSESDKNKQATLAAVVEEATQRLNQSVDSFLDNCIYHGTVEEWNKYPGAEPHLRAAFASVFKLRGDVSSPSAALSKAAKVVDKISEVLADGENYIRLSMGMERQVDLFPKEKAKKQKKN